MRRFFLLVLTLVATTPTILGQIAIDTAAHKLMMIQSPPEEPKGPDLLKLASLPELKMPAQYKLNKLTLPFLVDNSLQPYFRPIGWQQGYECGQSAGIAYNFTYELDRLRDVSASQLENQIVTHFSWDFLNNGEQYVGASAFDSWEIVRAAGSPNAVDYGGSISFGNHTRWMSGYTTYLAAMHNRLNNAYQLNVSNEEGLMVLKQWIYDHLDGSTVGGVCNCYMGYFTPTEVLPAGTPDAGKAVRTSNSGAGHTWTLVGYNDSIRWDYNSDGQYTNHIDINGDGQVTMQDWEIGGLKFANGYAGPGWGNNGFCYLMYKCLADPYGAGGIWNNTVFMLNIKEDCNPQLTYKVTLKHDCRNMIKVKAGIALNVAATKPEFYLDFPIFDYQGGALYMQGGTTEADKTLEFGLDCSPLLSYITSGQSVKYFLDVYEKDPSSTNSGEIVNFSVIDYTAGFNETFYSGTNIPLNNNDTTRLSLNKTVNFTKVSIVTDSLTAAPLNEPYAFQLTAADGEAPYRWDIDYTPAESSAPSTFPTTNAITLVFSNNGYAVQNLGFSFPFCGKQFSQIFVSPEGFLQFNNSLYTWPFIIDPDLLFKWTRIIGPFVTDLSYYSGENVWFESNAQSATVRWKASLNGQSATDVNFAVTLYPSGKIEFQYGSISVPVGTHYLSGYSSGDNRNYHFTQASSNISVNATPFCITLIPAVMPVGLELSEDGLLNGTAIQELNDTPLPIRVTDNNNIWTVKTFDLSTNGVLMTYSLQAGSDTIVQAGETVKLTLTLKNIGVDDINAATVLLSETDTLVTMIDSTEWLGDLAAGDSITLDTAFTFIVGATAYEGHIIDLLATIVSPTDTFNNHLLITVHSFILEAGNTTVADGNNNQLEPGETAALIIELKNVGGATASNIDVHLSCSDPYISISSADAHIDSLSFGETQNLFYIISASSSLPAQRIIVFNLDITAAGNYQNHDFVVLVIGQYGETFETADFTLYPWVLTGNTNWYVQDTVVYAGSEAAKSGNISDNQTSVLTVSSNILADGQIRFFRKVSCEADNTNHNYDYLAFYIDGTEQERWDGEKNWDEAVYNVSAGNHIFRWSYVKDYSVSTGSDCAWLDNIVFPPMGDTDPQLNIYPSSLFEEVLINDQETRNLSLTNNGADLIIYTSEVEYINPQQGDQWFNPTYYAGSLDPGQNLTLPVVFDATGLQIGTYNCTFTITSNFDTTTTIPVTLSVISSAGWDEPGLDRSAYAAPNPFVGQTTLYFTNPRQQEVSVMIYDMSGRLVRTLFDGQSLDAGAYSVVLDASDDHGLAMQSGLYICNIRVGDESHMIRLAHINK